ncbi:MAG: hypothetical protein H6633_26725 [Anaerolineales bacterium]|nr:hypothetical protein [Anaerolineales bacterium]
MNLRTIRPAWKNGPVLLVIVVAPALLACGFWGISSEPDLNHVIIRNQLPTLTPTYSPTHSFQVTPLPQPAAPAGDAPALAPKPAPIDVIPSEATTGAPSKSPVEVTRSGSTPMAAAPAANMSAPPTPVRPLPAAPNLETSGWSFAGIRWSPAPYQEGLVLYGDMVNNTGVAQELSLVSGTFYDGQGGIIADAANTVDYWPIDIIPPGDQVPFELTISNIQSAADFNLNVTAQPSNQSPYHDFQFLDIKQWTEDESYCLAGNVDSPNSAVHDYLVIAAVLFDAQNNIVTFGDDFESGPALSSGAPVDFEICIDLTAQDVARYELRAWGQ